MRRLIVTGALGGVVLLAAAAAGWYFVIRDDVELADSAPEIPDDLRSVTATGDTGSPTIDAASSAIGEGGFAILADRSTASYFADEKLAALSLPSTAQETTRSIEGVIYLTDEGLDAAQESAFTVDVSSLASDEGRRDNRVRDALGVSQYPTATFVASALSGPFADLNAESDTALTLTGMLDLHGVAKEVVWDVLARRDGDIITATATVNFLYEEFDITAPNIANFVSVEDDVTLQVQIVAQAS